MHLLVGVLVYWLCQLPMLYKDSPFLLNSWASLILYILGFFAVLDVYFVHELVSPSCFLNVALALHYYNKIPEAVRTCLDYPYGTKVIVWDWATTFVLTSDQDVIYDEKSDRENCLPGKLWNKGNVTRIPQSFVLNTSPTDLNASH